MPESRERLLLLAKAKAKAQRERGVDGGVTMTPYTQPQSFEELRARPDERTAGAQIPDFAPAPQQPPTIGSSFSKLAGLPQREFFQTIQRGVSQAREGSPMMGVTGGLTMAKGILNQAFSPLVGLSELLHRDPAIGGAADVLESPIRGLAMLGSGAAEGGFDLASQGGHTPMGTIPPNFNLSPRQLSETRQAVGETGATLAPFAAPMIPALAKPIVRGAAKLLPKPGGVYSRAAGLSYVDEFDRGVAARGVQERIKLGGSYEKAPKNYQKIESEKSKIYDTEINPRIQKITDAGVSFDMNEFVEPAFNEMLSKKGHPLLRSINKQEYIQKLTEFKDEFIKGNKEKLTPNDIQEIKTSTHEQVPFDKYGTLRNSFEKAIARQMRLKLESYDKGLRPLNQRWAELNRLSKAQLEIGEKSGKVSSSPFSSMPFYMAIGDPLRGGILGEARNISKAPGFRTGLAFNIDKLQNLGRPKPISTAPPPQPFIEHPKGSTVNLEGLPPIVSQGKSSSGAAEYIFNAPGEGVHMANVTVMPGENLLTKARTTFEKYKNTTPMEGNPAQVDKLNNAAIAKYGKSINQLTFKEKAILFEEMLKQQQ